MTSVINKAILKLPKRAETTARQILSQTFVDVGPLFTLLSVPDHQILYGRRGTGKTHVLNFLADSKEKDNDAVVVIDLRSIGSSSGLYADGTIPLPERATRLLVDTLLSIHASLLEFFINRAEELDLSHSGPALDRLGDAITEVKVVGNVETTESMNSLRSKKQESRSGVSLNLNPSISAGSASDNVYLSGQSKSTRRAGQEHLYVNFGSTSAAFRNIVSCMSGNQLWVLLDEWSSIPLELQPYLADLIRRSLYPVQGVTVKIAAIEHRSSFIIWKKLGDYIGIETGADASADVNLDDFMVFDNDAEKAQKFFQALISQHILAVTKDTELESQIPINNTEIMNAIFTEKRSIEEFVRACEGVPRDAINILSISAQLSLENSISVSDIRVASRKWYQRDKENAVSANEISQSLLHWIIDQVIGKRRARAFLIRADKPNELVHTLYDSRVIHVLKRGVSSHDQPGVRYDVYKLDYGCYVDLLNTSRAPQGLLPFEEEGDLYIEVPPDDYRSIRRAILDLDEFYKNAMG